METPRSDWPKIQAWAEKWTAENVPGQDPAFVWAAVERIRHAGRKVTAESVMARLRQNGRAR